MADSYSFDSLQPVLTRLDEIQAKIWGPRSSRSQSSSADFSDILQNRIQEPDGQIGRLINYFSDQHGLSSKLVTEVIRTESGFDPGATSPKGAMGLMQLMPQTAKSLGVTNPYDPAQNISGGVRYLKQMLQRFQHNLPLALAAYNAGPKAVETYGGIPPYPETQNYVKKILRRL